MGALIVYDVTKRCSFDNVSKWHSDLITNAEKDCVIALVANKVDLVERNSRKREVSYEEGKQLAMCNNMLFYETSAFTNMKVNDCFEDLLQEIYNERRKVKNIRPNNNKIISLSTQDDSKKKCC